MVSMMQPSFSYSRNSDHDKNHHQMHPREKTVAITVAQNVETRPSSSQAKPQIRTTAASVNAPPNPRMVWKLKDESTEIVTVRASGCCSGLPDVNGPDGRREIVRVSRSALPQTQELHRIQAAHYNKTNDITSPIC